MQASNSRLVGRLHYNTASALSESPYVLRGAAEAEQALTEALCDAARDGDLTTLTRLLEEGVSVNATSNSWTAIMWAAGKDKLDCLDHLIAKGANLNAQNLGKLTALHYAADEGHVPCVESLLKAGADASLKDRKGKTALGIAKKIKYKTQHHTEVIKILENPAAYLAAQAKAKQRAAKHAALPEHLQLGVTLPGMRQLLLQLPPDAVERVNAKMEERNAKRVAQGKPPFPMNVAVNGYINHFFIECWEQEDRLTVCQRLQSQKSPHVGKATVFVSWFLETRIDTLLDALACFIKQKGLREEDTFFWVCDYVIRQTNVGPDLALLGECVSALGHTVLLMEPWHAPKPLKRAYCIKEVYHTQASGAKFDLVMSTKEQETFETALVTPTSLDSIRAGLSKVDVRQAECRNIKDKDAILLELEQGVGSVECNRLVVGLMRKALVTQAKAAQAAIAAEQATAAAREQAALVAAAARQQAEQAAAAARQLDSLEGLLDEM